LAAGFAFIAPIRRSTEILDQPSTGELVSSLLTNHLQARRFQICRIMRRMPAGDQSPWKPIGVSKVALILSSFSVGQIHRSHPGGRMPQIVLHTLIATGGLWRVRSRRGATPRPRQRCGSGRAVQELSAAPTASGPGRMLLNWSGSGPRQNDMVRRPWPKPSRRCAYRDVVGRIFLRWTSVCH
jgi:hypothetical protein